MPPPLALPASALEEYGRSLLRVGSQLGRSADMQQTVRRYYRYGQELERQCDEDTACLLICNPGNPTSHSYTADHLEELLRFAYKRRIPVVADEVYAFMTFDLDVKDEAKRAAAMAFG